MHYRLAYYSNESTNCDRPTESIGYAAHDEETVNIRKYSILQFSIVAYFVQVVQFTHTVICINKTNTSRACKTDTLKCLTAQR